jgi:very-short-patch-repair endonuclease
MPFAIDGSPIGLDRDALSDARRTSRLESQGFYVMRFWNVELIENFEGVVEVIWRHVALLPPPSPGARTRAALSHKGRGK